MISDLSLKGISFESWLKVHLFTKKETSSQKRDIYNIL